MSGHTRIISNFGATETAALPRLAPAVKDWQYYFWHPTHSGIQLRDHHDGLFELSLVQCAKLDHVYQGIFSTFPELQEYCMHDLYSKHPDPAKGFLYKWTSRADDVVVLGNGENLAPALMEASLKSSSEVKGAMVVGHGRFEPAALVDLGRAPPAKGADHQATLKALEPAITEANNDAPAHGHLDAQHILFAEEDRPIRYLGQGKIQRHQTFELYEKDFDRVYREAEEGPMVHEGEADDASRIDFTSQSSIKVWLQRFIADDSGIHELGGNEAFFEAGMNSLRVIRLVRELKRQVKRADDTQLAPKSLNPAVIYAHPTLNELSEHLVKMAKPAPQDTDSGYQTADSDETGGDSKLRDMESLLDKYVQSLPVDDQRQRSPVTEGTTVLLTGSTGSLGSYLLNELSNDANVQHIICLDRSATAAEKHRETGPERGLSPLDPKRVEFFKANLSDPQLGLEKEVYERLKNTVTHIIRKATPLSISGRRGEVDTDLCDCRLPMASQL